MDELARRQNVSSFRSDANDSDGNAKSCSFLLGRLSHRSIERKFLIIIRLCKSRWICRPWNRNLIQINILPDEFVREAKVDFQQL